MCRRKKKRSPCSQITPPTNNGSVSSINQFSAMPNPQTKTAASSQRDSRRMRYSSSSHKDVAKSSKSIMSPPAAVASCQKLNSRPQTPQASKTGSAPTQRPVFSQERSHGSNWTVRAIKPSVSAAVMAEKKFRPNGIQTAGNSRIDSVSSQSNGCPAIGIQSQPATFAVSDKLFIVTPWLKVTA